MPSISPSLVVSMGEKGTDYISSFTEQVDNCDHAISQFIETGIIGLDEEANISVNRFEHFKKENQKADYWLKQNKTESIENIADQLDTLYTNVISLEKIKEDFEYEVNDKVILTIIVPVFDLGSGIATRFLLKAIDRLITDNIISDLTTKLVCVLQDYDKERGRNSYSEEHFVGLANLEKNVKEFKSLVDHVFYVDNKNINHQALKFDDNLYLP
jgi:hypothetical protein